MKIKVVIKPETVAKAEEVKTPETALESVIEHSTEESVAELLASSEDLKQEELERLVKEVGWGEDDIKSVVNFEKKDRDLIIKHYAKLQSTSKIVKAKNLIGITINPAKGEVHLVAPEYRIELNINMFGLANQYYTFDGEQTFKFISLISLNNVVDLAPHFNLSELKAVRLHDLQDVKMEESLNLHLNYSQTNSLFRMYKEVAQENIGRENFTCLHVLVEHGNTRIECTDGHVAVINSQANCEQLAEVLKKDEILLRFTWLSYISSVEKLQPLDLFRIIKLIHKIESADSKGKKIIVEDVYYKLNIHGNASTYLFSPPQVGMYPDIKQVIPPKISINERYTFKVQDLKSLLPDFKNYYAMHGGVKDLNLNHVFEIIEFKKSGDDLLVRVPDKRINPITGLGLEFKIKAEFTLNETINTFLSLKKLIKMCNYFDTKDYLTLHSTGNYLNPQVFSLAGDLSESCYLLMPLRMIDEE